ncbi:MAG: carotenoid 1,2-hydratase, partial [Treponema sp.]|nr:carotenoid 1,2-hydratase [Treponema sp.]
MGKIVYTKGTGMPHGSFEDEFLTHKKCSEWWYCTGYLQNDAGDMFGYQFTLAKVRILGLKFRLLIQSVTDIKTGKHYNTQTPIFFGKGVTTTESEVSVKNKTHVTFEPNEFSGKGKMKLRMDGNEFALEVESNAVKPPVWHCDDGLLQMGIPGEKERTYYYSWTNLVTSGSLTINGKKYENLKGKTWFDRQGGTYTLTDGRTCWEWFSIRFFDDTEAMLFAFPQDNYYD